MTTASVVRYDASNAQDKADALEFGRLVQKLRLDLEQHAALRELALGSTRETGVVDLNVMIRRALAQAAPQLGPVDAVTDDTWCGRCSNTGLVDEGAAFVSCTCLGTRALPVTVVCLGERSVGECDPLSDILRLVPRSSPVISETERDALVQAQRTVAKHEARWAAARADGTVGIGASPIEALLVLEQQYDRGGILEGIAHRRDPIPEEHRTAVMEAVNREIAWRGSA